MAAKQLLCKLPGGYIDATGTLHQEAELRGLTGSEEEILTDKTSLRPAALVNHILSRVVTRIGTISPITESIAGQLLVADRQFLLMQLRSLTFGDLVQASVQCQYPDCKKEIDISFSVNDLPVTESVQKKLHFVISLEPNEAIITDDGATLTELCFRLPNGHDQELVAPMVFENEAQALTALLDRCIVRIGQYTEPSSELLNKLSSACRMRIEKEMLAIAPQVEMTLDAECAECGRTFSIPFDIQDFFFGEMQISIDRLYREVHYLAYHYHWSEQEILSMTREKRRAYIDILSEEIEKLNEAAQ